MLRVDTHTGHGTYVHCCPVLGYEQEGGRREERSRKAGRNDGGKEASKEGMKEEGRKEDTKGGRKKESRKQRGGKEECSTAIYCLTARSNRSDVHLSELGNHSRGRANNV